MQWRRHQENGALVLPALQLICYLHEENKVKNKAPPLTFPNFFDFSAYLSQKVQVSQVQYFPDIAGLSFDNHVYLPKLRLFEMRYCPAHNIEELAAAISHLLEERGKGSKLAPASRDNALLEKLVIRLQWCSSCGIVSRNTGGIQVSLEPIRNLPSNADIYIDDSAIKRFGIKQ